VLSSRSLDVKIYPSLERMHLDVKILDRF